LGEDVSTSIRGLSLVVRPWLFPTLLTSYPWLLGGRRGVTDVYSKKIHKKTYGNCRHQSETKPTNYNDKL
jgi:hypothetical protein